MSTVYSCCTPSAILPAWRADGVQHEYCVLIQLYSCPTMPLLGRLRRVPLCCGCVMQIYTTGQATCEKKLVDRHMIVVTKNPALGLRCGARACHTRCRAAQARARPPIQSRPFFPLPGGSAYCFIHSRRPGPHKGPWVK